jgi:CCR4-NOT transcriptional complex subunit CAF120
MNEGEGSQLQNVLSISTAASNRYLLHFNSLNSLTQWTAGIRLAMYEYATLQEAYTGSLVAGKGKTLNNIRQILERNKFKHEDWARVRFGAGTPWRRCWFVVSPPDEKEWEKAQKMAKKSKYAKAPVLKGDIKFYESRKINKRTRPIATITNAYSAYAIYPQSKPLIDQSTLVKIEGRITIHSMPESVTDGFVFVMPEVHPAISGFEMLLRFLFPVWDTFALYGRPARLIADVLDQRGLMFAMPRDRRYGYLEILDVAGLIHSEGSSNWNERQWRSSLKELTSKRMLAVGDEPRRSVTNRASLPGARNSVLRFDESDRNTPNGQQGVRRAETALGNYDQRQSPAHRRVASEANGVGPYQRDPAGRLAHSTTAIDERDYSPPRPPPHSAYASAESVDQSSRPDSGAPSPGDIPPEVRAMATRSPPPEPVDPPIFAHAPSEKPRLRPNQAPELRRGISDLDAETRAQMAEATNKPGQIPQQAPPPYGQNVNGYGYHQNQYLPPNNNSRGTSPSGGGYRGNAPHTNRLSTIPASPYIEQESPILDRAGAVLPPPTVQEHPAPSPPHTVAAAAALAALSATPPYTKSPSPVHRSPSPNPHTNNPLEQAYNMYKVNSNSSTSLQKVATGGSAHSGGAEQRPNLENRHSVQRKPVGSSRLSGQNQMSATTPPAGAQWNPNRFSYESPPVPEHGYGPSPGEQQGAGYGFPPQQGPPPPAHGQLPYRPAPQQHGQQGW